MKQKRIVVLVVSAIFIVLINWFCSKSKNTSTGGSTPPASGNSITIANMAFGPATLTVKAGTTVTWKNSDGYAHTVTSDDGTTFDSGMLAGAASFSYTANTAGTYAYHCNIHSGMKATLIVTQ